MLHGTPQRSQWFVLLQFCAVMFVCCCIGGCVGPAPRNNFTTVQSRMTEYIVGGRSVGLFAAYPLLALWFDSYCLFLLWLFILCALFVLWYLFSRDALWLFILSFILLSPLFPFCNRYEVSTIQSDDAGTA